jgi:site-specific recombinase XerD
MRNVINQAIIEGHTDKNKTIGYKISIEIPERIFLTEEEVKVFEAVETNSLQDQQIKDMFLFASMFTGLRFSDMLYLKVKNVKDSQLFLRIKKGKKPHSVPLLEDAEKLLMKYCRGKQQDEFVFPFKNSQKLADPRLDPFEEEDVSKAALSYYNKVVKKLAERAGLEKHVSSHVGRRSFACTWIANVKNIYSLKNMLSHNSVRETEIYAQLSSQTLRDEINQLYPKTT